MAIIPSVFDEALPDGVYLDLSEDEYFAQETRGSSDWITLNLKKWGWWWSSPYNPRRKTSKAQELTYGSALHCIMLEGLHSYNSRYAAEPDPAEYPDALTKIDQMKKALLDAGFQLKGVSAWKLADWCAAMRENLPQVPVLPNMLSDFHDSLGPVDRPGRKKVVTAFEDWQLRLMYDVALGDDHPDNADVRKIFTSDDHPPLAEVTVLATINGIRRRWRFDRMFPTFDLDLKSMGNWFGRPLEYETGELIAKRRYDMQRADYLFGRTVAYELIRHGKLFGGTLEQRKWIATWPDKFEKWDWVWLFYQKPDPAGVAPVLFPVWDDTFKADGELGDLAQYGANKIAKSIQFYRTCLDEFGLDRPWAKVAPLHYTAEGEKNRIFVPHYVQEDAPTSADAYESQEGSTDE